MKNNYFRILFILLFASTLTSCYTVFNSTITPHLIKFDVINYPPTNINEIVIYSARIDIPQKYLEIGTIKFEDEVDISKIKELAAQNGANALLKEGNNYILLFFSDQKEGKKDVKTI